MLKRLRPATVVGAVCGSWLVLIPLTATGHQVLTVVAVFTLVFALPLIGALVSLSVLLDSPAHLQGRISTATTMLAVSIAWIGPGATGFLIAGPGAQTASLVLAAPLAVMLLTLLTSARLRAAFNTLSTGDPAESPMAEAEAEAPAEREHGPVKPG